MGRVCGQPQKSSKNVIRIAFFEVFTFVTDCISEPTKIQNVLKRSPKLSAKMHLENLPKNMQKSLQKWSKNGRKSGPKRSREVPGGPKSSKIRFPGPWGVQGGSRGAPRRSRRHKMDPKSKKRKPRTASGTIFSQCLAMLGGFWNVFGGPGGSKSGSKTGSVFRV